jgi:hypothetical protein
VHLVLRPQHGIQQRSESAQRTQVTFEGFGIGRVYCVMTFLLPYLRYAMLITNFGDEGISVVYV